ncbi:MAG: triphosphoribosyl-dephospho-CoA synthase [Desulfurococcales archaeon ex4484_58]|nr:MAG: triphosphoribosyl-dephospho-CoA synthase [Desulfurococcales archaeon ex4484_58]
MYPVILASSLSLEASAYPKPGNVHRLSDLPDLRFEDFILTSSVASKWFTRGFRRGKRGWGRVVFGDLIYWIIRDTYVLTGGKNPCLGSSLLLTPLSVSIGKCVREGREELECFIEKVNEVLEATTVYDTIYFYRAVRIVKPSYIRKTDFTSEYVNIWSRKYVKELLEKNHRLIDVLRFSSKKDIIADELINGYPRSRDAVGFLKKRLKKHNDWNRGIVETQIYLMSKYIDTLVARKHGVEKAEYVRKLGEEHIMRIIEDQGGEYSWLIEAHDLDKHLKKYRINPGSIADLVVTTIAFYLLEKYIEEKPLLLISQG